MIYSDSYWENAEKAIFSVDGLEELKNRSILITGASGMVCSAIIELLFFLNNRFNYNISLYLAGRSYERINKRFMNIGKYEYVYFDALKEWKYSHSIDYLIHGASNANPQLYDERPIETIIENIIGTKSVLEFAKQHNCRRVLYISSSEVYGQNKEKNHLYCEEDYGYIDILNPRSCYPNGKRAAETLCASYNKEYDLNSVIVRLGHVYGPTITESDTRASAQFLRNAAAGKDILMKSDGHQLRSYIFTMDCAAAIIEVLLNGEKNEAYNISSKSSVISIRKLAEIIAGYASVSIQYANPSDKELRSYNMMDCSALNSDKLERLGWKSCFNVYDGVRCAIDALKG